jgi:hypothetical protein
VVGTGFNPSCHCTVVLDGPANDTAVPMIAVDTIASSTVKCFFHRFNILYKNDGHILIVFRSVRKIKTNCTMEIRFDS